MIEPVKQYTLDGLLLIIGIIIWSVAIDIIIVKVAGIQPSYISDLIFFAIFTFIAYIANWLSKIYYIHANILVLLHSMEKK